MKNTIFNSLLATTLAIVALLIFGFLFQFKILFSTNGLIFSFAIFVLFNTLFFVQNKFDLKRNLLIKRYNKNKHEIIALKASAKYRKEFLGDVSHELKTPIFNIQGYTLTLLDGGIFDNEINVKYLERTEKNISRLISIVNDLRTISKLEEHELKLKFTKIDIVQLSIEVFEMLEVKAIDADIKISISSEKSSHFAYADKNRITEVVSNLVTNAIRYGEKGGFVKISISENQTEIITEVTDNGIGIEDKDIKRVFARFYRVDKSRSTKLGGTGLGLAIVKHIIDAHNQTITVKSKLKIGSSFKFTLAKYKNKH